MSNDREERNRFLGIPIGTGPHARPGEEQQRVMGFPADTLDGMNLDGLRSLVHPILGYKTNGKPPERGAAGGNRLRWRPGTHRHRACQRRRETR